jgi:hypothetical protein
VYKLLIDKPEGNRPLRKPTDRWEDNIKTDITETTMEAVE